MDLFLVDQKVNVPCVTVDIAFLYPVMFRKLFQFINTIFDLFELRKMSVFFGIDLILDCLSLSYDIEVPADMTGRIMKTS